MGTNYYINCRFCSNEIKHIGKHSNNEFLSNMTKKEFENYIIKHWEYIINEYGEKISKEEFFKRTPLKWVLIKDEFS